MSDSATASARIFLWFGSVFCLVICQVGCSRTDSPSVATLIAKLKEGDYQTRIESFTELQKLGAKAKPAIPTLIKMLDDNNPELRAAAIGTLGTIGSDAKTAIPVLVHKLRYDKARNVRCAAAKALAGIGVNDSNILAALTVALADSDTRVQIDAAVTLAGLDPDSRDAVSTLAKLLTYKESDTRDHAAFSLAQIESTRIKSAVPALVIALKDSDARVRIATAQSLGYICEESKIVVPALIEMVNEEKGDFVRVIAIQALGEFGPEANAAIPALTRALEDSNHDVRVAAFQSLDCIKTWKKKRGKKGIKEEYEASEKVKKEIDETIRRSKWFWER